jgi:hypothetical protein
LVALGTRTVRVPAGGVVAHRRFGRGLPLVRAGAAMEPKWWTLVAACIAVFVLLADIKNCERLVQIRGLGSALGT